MPAPTRSQESELVALRFVHQQVFVPEGIGFSWRPRFFLI